MQFQTPQFIEVEDKIIGPLSFRQFLYVAGGAGMSYALYTLLPFFFAILLIIPLVALALALAFLKINERPFINVLEAAFHYTLKGKLYIWKQGWKKTQPKKKVATKEDPSTSLPEITVPTLSQSKLKDMAWSLDVQKNVR